MNQLQRYQELKVPPHSIEAEQSVLGGLMLDNLAWEQIADRITKEDFYRKEHRLIFRSIASLEAADKPFDVVTLSEELEKTHELNDAGGLVYLGRLAKDTPSAANIRAYAEIVREKSIRRQLISTGSQIAELAHDESDIATKIDKAQSLILGIESHNKRASNGPTLIANGLTAVFDDLDKRLSNGGSIAGLSTGFDQFDQMTAGLHPGDLIVIAGRPSMGKTTLAMNIAEYISLNGTRVLVFSLEMPSKQIIERQIASLAKIKFQKFRTANLEEPEWSRITIATSKLKDAPLYIDDTSALTVNEVRSRARRLNQKHRLGLIIVDYLQLMKADGANRNLEITEISNGLKALAKEMNTPVIALSQLNRSLEQRTNKRPVMSDLRESGAIEQDADLIAFIYRDEVYNDNSEQKGIAELIIRKQRSGPTGTVPLSFHGELLRFNNYTGPALSNKQTTQKWHGGFHYEQED